MLSLIERNIAALDSRLVLLPPKDTPALGCFKNAQVDQREHRHFLEAAQRLRGQVYLADGAIAQAELSSRGLLRSTRDDRSWHLLMLDGRKRVTGCIWYLEHETPTMVRDLRVAATPLASCTTWGPKLKRAVESDIDAADRAGIPYGEVGGWAIAPTTPSPTDGILLAVGAYSLSRILGGALGMTTATVRHASAPMLRRLGGRNFEVDGQCIPPYFNPKYKCEMELLRFDSRRADHKYDGAIEMLKDRLPDIQVVARTAHSKKSFGFPYPTYQDAGLPFEFGLRSPGIAALAS